MPSSPIQPLSRQRLTDVLAKVPDPRARRGVRHRVPTILALAVVGVLAGARTLVALWQHLDHMDRHDLEALGVPADKPIPSGSTIRRVLAAIDPHTLDRLIAAWMCVRVGARESRRVIAVDGKTMRGARPRASKKNQGPDNSPRNLRAPHLLAAPDQATGTVVAQEAVTVRSNEIPALKDLLADMDLTDAVITADALHTQRDTIEWIRGRGGHFVFTVKANQPALCDQLRSIDWKNLPATRITEISHGRRTCRTIGSPGPALDRFPARGTGPADETHTDLDRHEGPVEADPRTGVPHLFPAHAGRPAPPGSSLGPGPLGYREPAPLGERRHLRRGPPPVTHR